MTTVTLLALPGAFGSALTIPLEMISAARDIARSRRHPSANLRITIASNGLSSVDLMGGMRLQCEAKLPTLSPTSKSDIVFVPGFWGNPRAMLAKNEGVVSWLAEQQPPIICAITTGSYFVAEAGLLDDCDATTHWRFFDDFEARYPSLNLQRNRFITRSSNRYCTGSVDAVRDVVLHLVAHLFDRDIATEIARHFTHEIGPSLQSALLAASPQDSHHDETIALVQTWIHENYDQQITNDVIANLAGMSIRNLARRFKKATRTTPSAYLRNTRLEEARALLRDSDASIIEIGDLVGYRDTSHFIDAFKKHTKSTPGEYRRLVRAKVFAAD